jgi:hypothetical protein
MTDPIEALKQIGKLVDVAHASDDIAFVRNHLEMVKVIVDKAVTPDTFQTRRRAAVRAMIALPPSRPAIA